VEELQAKLDHLNKRYQEQRTNTGVEDRSAAELRVRARALEEEVRGLRVNLRDSEKRAADAYGKRDEAERRWRALQAQGPSDSGAQVLLPPPPFP
jgi:hypothetical protein